MHAWLPCTTLPPPALSPLLPCARKRSRLGVTYALFGAACALAALLLVAEAFNYPLGIKASVCMSGLCMSWRCRLLGRGSSVSRRHCTPPTLGHPARLPLFLPLSFRS